MRDKESRERDIEKRNKREKGVSHRNTEKRERRWKGKERDI